MAIAGDKESISTVFQDRVASLNTVPLWCCVHKQIINVLAAAHLRGARHKDPLCLRRDMTVPCSALGLSVH